MRNEGERTWIFLFDPWWDFSRTRQMLSVCELIQEDCEISRSAEIITVFREVTTPQ